MSECFETSCSLYPGWEIDHVKNIQEFYTDLNNVRRDLDTWLEVDGLGYVAINNIFLSVQVILKDRYTPKPIGLTDAFWVDVATGNIDLKQL